jgi:hypothetical protein
VKVRASIGVSADFMPLKESFFRGVCPTARTLDFLNVMAIRKMQAVGSHATNWKVDYFVDYSQSLTRERQTFYDPDMPEKGSRSGATPSTRPPKTAIRCLTTSTRVFSFERSRCAVPVEHLAMQGFPLPWLMKQPLRGSSNQIRHLAGEGMNLASITAVLACALKTMLDDPLVK